MWLLEWFPFIHGAGDLQCRSPAFNNSGSGKGQALNSLSHSGLCFSTASTAHSFSAAIHFLRIIVNTPVNAAPTSLAIVPQTWQLSALLQHVLSQRCCSDCKEAFPG